MSTFSLLDSLSEPGHPVNEDVVGATTAAAWVVDGTSGPFGRMLVPGPSNAAWLSRALRDALAVQFAAPCADPLRRLGAVAEQVSAAYRASALREAPPHEQPSACLAMASCARDGGIHLLNIGDCRILIEQDGAVHGFGTSAIDRLEADLVADFVRLRTDEPDRDPWPTLRASLRRNFEQAMNKAGGYWVTHPTLPWLPEVQHRRLPPGAADHLLLMSDGFFQLVDVFGAYDEASLFAAARHGCGLAGLLAELRQRSREDAECRRHPRIGAMDDASAILVRVLPRSA